jgi:hypothetical protein
MTGQQPESPPAANAAATFGGTGARITDASRHAIKIISRAPWIKGTSSCTVPAAAPGTVVPDEWDVRPI